MDTALDNIQDMSIDGGSRSARWKNLRQYLKDFIKIADENSDKLAFLEAEASRIRESNLKLTEAIQVLSDLVNEEVQREISLTLNDTDFDIVADEPAVLNVASDFDEAKEDTYTVDEFIEMLRGVKGIGEKKLQAISSHLNRIQDNTAQPSLNFEIESGENYE